MNVLHLQCGAGGRGGTALCFFYTEVWFFYTVTILMQHEYILKRSAYSKEFEYIASVESMQLRSVEQNTNTVHFYYNDLFMTGWNPIAFSYTGTLPVKDFQTENNSFFKSLPKFLFSALSTMYLHDLACKTRGGTLKTKCYLKCCLNF